METEYSVHKLSTESGAKWFLRDKTDQPHPVKEFDHYPSLEEIEAALSMRRLRPESVM